MESYDFARCQRTDGSIYGTGGTCRKGTPVGPEVKSAKKKEKAKKPSDFEKGGKLVKGSLSNLGGNESYGRNVAAYEKKIANAKKALKADPDDDIAKFALEDAQKKLVKYENSKKVLDSVIANSPKGTEVTVSGFGAIRTKYTTPNGNTVETDFRRGSFNFQVNGEYDAGTVKQGRAEEMAVARQVQRVFNAHKDSLPQGFVVGTSAYTDDGRGASRQRAYERMGFSKGEPGDSIYARKDGNKMVPSNSIEEGKGNTLLMFKEIISEEENWHQAIFGKG